MTTPKLLLGATSLPVAPNSEEQREMMPLLAGFAKAMTICAAGRSTPPTPQVCAAHGPAAIVARAH